MAGRKKTKWQVDDVFLVPIKDGRFCVGHILGQSMINTVRIALYDEVIEDRSSFDIENSCLRKDLISLLEVTREQLDFGVWAIVGNKPSDIPVSCQPNEQFRTARWVGAHFKDAGLAEDFLNAFYGLFPWDYFFDADYLDKFLVDIAKKPKKIILSKS